MARAGRREQHDVPLRTCLGCRAVRAQGELVRLVAGEGQVVVDRDRRLPGRGAYLCPRPECARRVGRHLARALRRPGLNVNPSALEQAVGGAGGHRAGEPPSSPG